MRRCPRPLSAATYLAALGASTDGVLLVDRSGTIVYVNPAAEAFYDDHSLIGQTLSDLPMADRRTFCTVGRELLRTDRWEGRIAMRSSGPEVDVTVQRIGSDPNEPELCVVLHGVARRAEAEAPDTQEAHEARETPTKLQRFTSEIAHDFNNQIAVILNYTFVLLRQMPADSPLKAHVAEMQAAAWRASQVAQAIHRALSQQSLFSSSSGK